MLDQEYAETAAKQNSLGLSRQILDYWLRSMPQDPYNQERNPQVPVAGKHTASGRTGGTNEDQSGIAVRFRTRLHPNIKQPIKSEKLKVDNERSKGAVESRSNGSANAEISSKAHDMAAAKQVATDAPDVRESKIAALREQIAQKKYNVGADAIADKLVDDHLRMGGA